MKVFFSRPPKRCQEWRTPEEPTQLPVQPDKTESTRSGQRCRRRSLNRRQPFEKERRKEGRKEGILERESKRVATLRANFVTFKLFNDDYECRLQKQ